MNKEIKIKINDLDKIRRSAQEIIDTLDNKLQYSENSKVLIDSTYVSNKKLVCKDEYYELNNKEKEILKFISNNPGCSKEYVVENMSFSRPITLKYIDNLFKAGKIVSEKDINNARRHQLFINHENSLSALISNLQLFEKSYFDLIDKIELKNFDIISNEFTTHKRHLHADVVRALFTPFKILMHIFQFTLLFNHKNYTKRHNAFSKSIIYDTFEQISNKLTSSSVIKKIYKENKENVYFNYFGSIENIPYSINEMLQVMSLCKLDKEIEKVMDNLWNISFHYLPFIDPFFNRFSDKELQNWNQIMNDFRSSVYSKKGNYNPFIHKIMSSG